MEYDGRMPDGAPKPGTYRHYKGSLYQVFGMARHSETEEWMVVYQALYAEQGFWVRPLTVWMEPVTLHNSDTATTSLRFELINSSDITLTQLTKPE